MLRRRCPTGGERIDLCRQWEKKMRAGRKRKRKRKRENIAFLFFWSFSRFTAYTGKWRGKKGNVFITPLCCRNSSSPNLEDPPMKKSKDPFEIAFEERDESPPESPTGPDENEAQTPGALTQDVSGDDDISNNLRPTDPSTSAASSIPVGTAGPTGKSKEEDEEEEEENMDVELGKLPSSGDPDKTAIMQTILSQFTEGQMSRYESFRRSGFQKSNMKRLLTSITGSAKISMPMTIVVSGIAKMFVGELVETARIVMAERKESGPIRPCHMREAYRRLKLEGKIPKRSVPRLFR
ncbi:putative Histone-fold [Abeliophyllum distichum]|uniref:Histone-fold n=1 Tax=Abeliophyllum distichum TaxID=126358 RepID=A0ABD1QXC5_9LAMI